MWKIHFHHFWVFFWKWSCLEAIWSVLLHLLILWLYSQITAGIAPAPLFLFTTTLPTTLLAEIATAGLLAFLSHQTVNKMILQIWRMLFCFLSLRLNVLSWGAKFLRFNQRLHESAKSFLIIKISTIATVAFMLANYTQSLLRNHKSQRFLYGTF